MNQVSLAWQPACSFLLMTLSILVAGSCDAAQDAVFLGGFLLALNASAQAGQPAYLSRPHSKSLWRPLSCPGDSPPVLGCDMSWVVLRRSYLVVKCSFDSCGITEGV